MDRCGCDEHFSIFDRKTASHDLDRYRRSGPDRTTRILLDMVRPSVSSGATVLDVGGGIGVIDYELLGVGADRAVLVDAAPAYIDVARDEARRRDLLDRLELVDGDFVHRAQGIDAADIVTLDRVVCCYPDVEALVGLSAAKARRLYGLVLPRDGWPMRLGLRLLNVGFWIRRTRYRTFVHSNALIDRLAAAHGLKPKAERVAGFWRVVVYERVTDPPGQLPATG